MASGAQRRRDSRLREYETEHADPVCVCLIFLKKTKCRAAARKKMAPRKRRTEDLRDDVRLVAVLHATPLRTATQPQYTIDLHSPRHYGTCFKSLRFGLRISSNALKHVSREALQNSLHRTLSAQTPVSHHSQTTPHVEFYVDTTVPRGRRKSPSAEDCVAVFGSCCWEGGEVISRRPAKATHLAEKHTADLPLGGFGKRRSDGRASDGRRDATRPEGRAFGRRARRDELHVVLRANA